MYGLKKNERCGGGLGRLLIVAVLISAFIWAAPTSAFAEMSPEEIQLQIDLIRAKNRVSDLYLQKEGLNTFLKNYKQMQGQFQTAWSEFGSLQLKIHNIFAANRLKTIFSLAVTAYQEVGNALAFGSGTALGLLNKAADLGQNAVAYSGEGSYYQKSVGKLSETAKNAVPEMKRLAGLLKVPPEWYAQDVGADSSSALAGIFAKMREVEEQLNKTEKALDNVEKEWRQAEKQTKEQLKLLNKDLEEAVKAVEALQKKAAAASISSEKNTIQSAIDKSKDKGKEFSIREEVMLLDKYHSFQEAYEKIGITKARKLQEQAKGIVAKNYPLAVEEVNKAFDEYMTLKNWTFNELEKAGIVSLPLHGGIYWSSVEENVGPLAYSADSLIGMAYHHMFIFKTALPWIKKAAAAVSQGISNISQLESPLSKLSKAQHHLSALWQFVYSWEVQTTIHGWPNIPNNGAEGWVQPFDEFFSLETANNKLIEFGQMLPIAEDTLSKTAAAYKKNFPVILSAYEKAYSTSSELITNADNADAQMGVARGEYNELLKASGYSKKMAGWEGVLDVDVPKLKAYLEALMEKDNGAGIDALKQKLTAIQKELERPVRRYNIAAAQYAAYYNEIIVRVSEWRVILYEMNTVAAEPDILLTAAHKDSRLLMETWPALAQKRNISRLRTPDFISIFKGTPYLHLYDLRRQVEREGLNLPCGVQLTEFFNTIATKAYDIINEYEQEHGGNESMRKAYWAVLAPLEKLYGQCILKDRVARILPVLRKDVSDAKLSLSGNDMNMILASIGLLEKHLLPDSEASLAKTNSEVASLLREAENLIRQLKDAVQRSKEDKFKDQVNQVKALYEQFKQAYEGRNDSLVISFLGDSWEAGDGTTISDLQMNLSRTFRTFNEVNFNLQNLQINKIGIGKFNVSYDVTITSRIYSRNIKHEEKSSVYEEVTIDKSNKPKITRTMHGRFWYVK